MTVYLRGGFQTAIDGIEGEISVQGSDLIVVAREIGHAYVTARRRQTAPIHVRRFNPKSARFRGSRERALKKPKMHYGPE